jgi:hypothetical protein
MKKEHERAKGTKVEESRSSQHVYVCLMFFHLDFGGILGLILVIVIRSVAISHLQDHPRCWRLL